MPASPATDTRDNESTNFMSRLRGMRIVYWPNDCPDCATRMEFITRPHVPAHRRCPDCGRTVTAQEALR